MTHNVYRAGRVHVCGTMCKTCIFHPGNRMRLQPGRVEGMVKSAGRDGTAIICHDTLGTGANAVCRGYWEKHRQESATLRLAVAMGVVEFVKMEQKKQHRPLSARAWQVLGQIGRGDNPFHYIRGQAAHGGMDRILRALFVRGFIDRQNDMMPAGYAALDQHAKKRRP